MHVCRNDDRWLRGLKRTLSNLDGWSVEDDHAVNERKQLYVVFDDGNVHSNPRSFAIGIVVGNVKAKVCIVSKGDPRRMRGMRIPSSLKSRVERLSKKDFLKGVSGRTAEAERRCIELREKILSNPYGELLRRKRPVVYDFLSSANIEIFREWTFRDVSWCLSKELQQLSTWMQELKACISILHNRDTLGEETNEERKN